MKHTARCALFLVVLVPFACKGKDKAPELAASTALASAAPPSAAPGVSAGPAALEGFEGEIALTAQGKFERAGVTGPTNLTLLVKDGKFRVAIPDSVTAGKGVGKAYVLVMPAEKKLYAVLEEKKQSVLIDLDKLATQAKSFGQGRTQPKSPGASSATPPKLEKTGKTDTVAGYKCEIWHFTSAKSQGDACITEQGTSWFHIPLSGAPAELAWASQLSDGQHFPLRLVINENGAEQARIEVTSIQKKVLPASDFELPPGYAVLSIDQMLAAMMSGGFAAGTPGTPALPAGVKLPPGITLPPGFKLPKH